MFYHYSSILELGSVVFIINQPNAFALERSTAFCEDASLRAFILTHDCVTYHVLKMLCVEDSR